MTQPMPVKIVANPKRPYKAIYTIVLAALTAAAGIWVGNVYLTGALALLTAVGTYFVPNPLITVPDNSPVILSHPDSPSV